MIRITKNSFIIATIEPLSKLILRNKLKSNLKAGSNLGYSELKALIGVLFNYEKTFQSETELKDMGIAQNAIGKGYKYFYYGVLDVNSLKELAKFSKYRKEIVETDFYYCLSVSASKGLNELFKKKTFSFKELLKISKSDLKHYLNNLQATLDTKEIDGGYKDQLAHAYKRPKWDNSYASLDKLQELEEFLMCLKNPDNINPNLGKLVFLQLIDVLNQLPELGSEDLFDSEESLLFWTTIWEELQTTFVNEDLTPTRRLLNLLKQCVLLPKNAIYCVRRYRSMLSELHYNISKGCCSIDSKSKVEKITDFFEILYLLSMDIYRKLGEITYDIKSDSSDADIEYWYVRMQVFDGFMGYNSSNGELHQPFDIAKDGTVTIQLTYVDRDDGYKEKKKPKSYDFKIINPIRYSWEDSELR